MGSMDLRKFNDRIFIGKVAVVFRDNRECHCDFLYGSKVEKRLQPLDEREKWNYNSVSWG